MQLKKWLVRAITLFLGLIALPGAGWPASECKPVAPPFGHWRLASQQAGTTLYLPEINTVSLPSAAASIHWQFSPRALYETVRDYDEFSTFIPNVVTSHLISTSNNKEWIYQVLQFPALARDRHYLLQSSWQEIDSEKMHYRIDWHLSDRFPLPPGGQLVVPKQFSGCWDIRASDSGGTEAIYRIELDPGGWLPPWLVQSAMHHYLQSLMSAIRNRLENGRK